MSLNLYQPANSLYFNLKLILKVYLVKTFFGIDRHPKTPH